jgi:hypothetical protein
MSILPIIVEQYDNSPHTALDNITPNDAISDPKKRMHVMYLNMQKAQQNGFITDLEPGDKVRIDGTALIKKKLTVGGVIKYMWYSQQVGRQ